MSGKLQDGYYAVVLIDPPYAFQTYSEKGKGKSADQHYRCHGVGQLAALPVGRLAAPDSVLYLWIPWPFMPHAFTLITAWGFAYSGLAWEWVKYNPATGKFAFGCGYGTRKNLEPCLLARRGSPKLKSRRERDFILAPRREHSRKPDEQYQRIEAMFDGPYLELFARQPPRPGWTAWGDQIRLFDRAARPAAQ